MNISGISLSPPRNGILWRKGTVLLLGISSAPEGSWGAFLPPWVVWRPVDTGRKVRNKNPLEQWAPTFLAPGACFMEGNFSTYWAWGDCFGMIWARYISCTLYFHDYYINCTSGHQALDLGGWDPCFRGLPAKKPGILTACFQEELGSKIWAASVSLLIDGRCLFCQHCKSKAHRRQRK